MLEARSRATVSGVIIAACVGVVAACGGHASQQPPTTSSVAAATTTTTAHPVVTTSRSLTSIAVRPAPDGDWSTFDYNAQRNRRRAARHRHRPYRRAHAAAARCAPPRDRRLVGDPAACGARRRPPARCDRCHHDVRSDDRARPGHRPSCCGSSRPATSVPTVGSAQVTTATPVADPDRRYIYAASPDGLIHKLAVATGRQVSSAHWPARITLLPRAREDRLAAEHHRPRTWSRSPGATSATLLPTRAMWC